MKYQVLLIIMWLFCTHALAQNIIQPLNEFFSKGKLDEWSFSSEENKQQKIKKHRIKGLFSFEKEDEDFLLKTHPSNLVSLVWKADIKQPIAAKQCLNISLFVQTSVSKSLNGLKFYYQDNETKVKIFELTKPIIDTISFNKWIKIEFSFYTKVECKKGAILLEYFNVGSKGMKLKDFCVQTSDDKEENSNLIHNPSFEDHYYFQDPTKINYAFGEGVLFWNDFNSSASIVEMEKEDIYISEGLRKYTEITSLATDYLNDKNYRIKPFEGHSSLVIQNEYVYTDKLVPLNSAYNMIYIQSELKEKLKKDSTYLLEFYILLNPVSDKADNSLGVRFTDSIYNPAKEVNFFAKDRPLPKGDILFFDSPLTSRDWTKMSYEYKARGDEAYICFGVFQNSNHKKWKVMPSVKKRPQYGDGSAYLIDCVYLGLK